MCNHCISPLNSGRNLSDRKSLVFRGSLYYDIKFNFVKYSILAKYLHATNDIEIIEKL